MTDISTKPPPLEALISSVGQQYARESDIEVKKYIGQILEGEVKKPYRAPQGPRMKVK